MNGCPMALLAFKGGKELLFLTKLVQRPGVSFIAVKIVMGETGVQNNKITFI